MTSLRSSRLLGGGFSLEPVGFNPPLIGAKLNEHVAVPYVHHSKLLLRRLSNRIQLGFGFKEVFFY